MEIIPPKKIKVSDIPGKGRGVIALEDIKKDEIIEYCPVVFLSDEEAKFFDEQNTTLKFYYLYQYALPKRSLMLGYGSLYNHSKNPNSDIDYNTKNEQNFIIFEALKDIKAGEEIVYDYEFDDDKEEFLPLT